MFAIVGSGFGLYGYLPALAGGCSKQIVLPERYRERFLARTELQVFAHAVRWVANEDVMLDAADGVVLAVRPIDQPKWLAAALARTRICSLVLEKPLAHSPGASRAAFDNLIQSSKAFRIGYTFCYTAWAARLAKAIASKPRASALSIRWRFLAHHYRHDLSNWKRFHSAGGGAVRFYGIQTMALLAKLGYRDVLSSTTKERAADDCSAWEAVFSGPHLPDCHIVVDSHFPGNEFRVAWTSDDLAEMDDCVLESTKDPFLEGASNEMPSSLDRRVPIMSRLCESLWQPEGLLYEWYDATLSLWQRVEDLNQCAAAATNDRVISGQGMGA